MKEYKLVYVSEILRNVVVLVVIVLCIIGITISTCDRLVMLGEPVSKVEATITGKETVNKVIGRNLCNEYVMQVDTGNEIFEDTVSVDMYNSKQVGDTCYVYTWQWPVIKKSVMDIR